MHGSRRLLIIGLDGATFDLIDPWSRQGQLPHLTALMEQGLQARLESTIPAVTFPAWSSFMTGKNPGKHGIYDFVRLKPNSYELAFTGARSRRGKTLWRSLSDHGLRLGVMAVPTTYPPEPVNGFMISGFDSPVSTGRDPSFTYPRSLFDEINERVGRYRITDLGQFRIGRGWHAKALAHIHKILERKSAIARYLLQNQPWDLFMVLFGESDTVSHHFWAFHDSGSPRRPNGFGEQFQGAIMSVYKRLDSIIGQLMSLCDPHTAVMVLSDHGSGGAGDTVLYLNRWLEQEGFLEFRRTRPARTRAAAALRWAGLNLLPLKAQERLFQHGAAVTNAVFSQTRLGLIDWPRTRAFSTEMNTMPAIWINLKGRQPRGTVSPGRDYEQIRQELIDALSRFVNPFTGQKVVALTHRREDLYHGPSIDQAPDLVLELNLDEGYSYTCLPSGDPEGTRPLRRLRPPERLGAKGKGMNGSHRREGIFLYSDGPGRSRRPRRDIGIMDIAPTILRMFGVPVPGDMDGRVIPEIAERRSEPRRLDVTTADR
jgi:predicted AlkP superfamily phosphohydrolase/phosphomutase